MNASRQVLFLQGPPGRFFRDLADALQELGHGVHRVNFNGGDLAAWRLAGVNYHGAQSDWPAFLVRLLLNRAITDVVLFGDCRSMHRMARATAAGLGVAVHVFEEGYLRPDWITLERGGVNGFSTLPSDPQWYRQAAASLPPVQDHPALPEAFSHRAKATVAYYAAAVALAWAFPKGRTHRPWHPLLEASGWVRRLGRRQAAAARSAAETERLQEGAYFILPLQLDSDYQLRVHSDFDGMQAALAGVMASFARHAPTSVKLVVKEHPLDNGLNAWRRRTLDYARALGVSERVIFLEIGDIDLLVRSARGVVTVNSTTGTLALAAGVPVMTLGRAVYNIEGLTDQGSLGEFWNHPSPPRLDLYEAFQRVLAHTCLLHGGFYDLTSRSTLIAIAASRILATETQRAITQRPISEKPQAAAPPETVYARSRPARRPPRAAAARLPIPAAPALDEAVARGSAPIF